MATGGDVQGLVPRELVDEAYSRYTIGLSLILVVPVLAGAYDSVIDADGERLLGAGPLAAPAVVAVWSVLELLWRRSPVSLGTRLLARCLLSPLPLVLLSTVAWTAAGLSPWGQETIVERSAGLYDHYWWPEDARGPGVILLMLFAGFGIASALGVLTLLVAVLPLLALFRGREVVEGTDLRTGTLDDDAAALRTVRLAFAATAVSVVAATLWFAEISRALAMVGAVVTVVLLALVAVSARRKT